MGIVFTAVEWWLGFLRWTVLVVLSPLIVPFLLITWLARILGKSAVATLLALIAAPFTFGWWAAKTGGRFAADLSTSAASFASTVFLLPFRTFRAVFAPKHMTGQFMPAHPS